MTVKLRLTLPIHANETATSFVSRVGVLNGIVHARRFGTHMGFRFARLARGSIPDFDRAAALTGVDRAEFERGMIFIQNKKQHVMNGQILARDQVERERLRFCPHCIADDESLGTGRIGTRAWGRIHWQVKMIRSCPVHQCMLVTAAEPPPSRLEFDFTSMLSLERPRFAEHIQQAKQLAHGQFDQYVAGRLAGIDQSHEWLNSFPLYAAGRLTEVVGATLLKGPQFSRQAMTDVERAAAANEGMNVMVGGIGSFRTFVRDAIVKGFTVVKCEAGGASLLGRLYRWLAWETQNPVYDDVREAIRLEYVENLPVGPDEQIFGRSSERKWHSVQSLSRQYSVNPRTLRKVLLEAEMITAHQAKATDERVLIDADAADDFLRLVKQTIDRKAATTYCNVPYSQWDALVHLGHLKPLVESGRKIRFVQRFRPSDLDVFLEAIKRHANPELDLTSLESIYKARRMVGCPLAKAIDLVLSGGLTKIGVDPDTDGYMAIRICPEELRERTRGEEHGALSIRQAADLLRTKEMAISALIARGVIEAKIAINPVKHNKQTVIELDALQKFKDNFVSLFGLMAETGIHHRTLSKQLRDRNVKPCFDPEEVGVSFYLRVDLKI